MNTIRELISLQAQLFLLIGSGMVLKKTKVLPEAAREILTDLVISFILPCNIINSFRVEFDMNIIKNFAIIVLIAALIQVGCLILANLLYNRQPDEKKRIFQYATVTSNAGFLGNPIAEGVYGAAGLMYASIYLIPQRIVMWSAGLSYFAKTPNWKSMIKKILTHPCIIAVEIGMVLMVTQLPLPDFLGKTIKMAGNCTTTVSMVLIGTMLADVKWKSMVDGTVLFYTLVRLILIPGLTYLGCLAFHVDPLLMGVSVLLSGMPAGSTTAILAAKYNCDYLFATKCVVFSTLASLFTIPIWCMIM